MYSLQCSRGTYANHSNLGRAGGAMCVAAIIATVFILILGSPNLRAQCANLPPHNLCEDSCCRTDALLLNTGYDHGANGLYPIGSQDNYWTIVTDGQATRPVPRAADVITPAPAWAAALPNTRWINGNAGARDPFKVVVTYEKCFCVCGPDSTDLTFAMDILADNSAKVFVDNIFKGNTPTPGFTTPTTLVFTMRVAPGRHCIEVQVVNNGTGFSGLDIRGTVQGAGLLKYNCCGAAPVSHDNCDTNHVTFGTDSTWTLVSGPDTANVHPRCADNIPSPNPAWGTAISGTHWIGANPTGTSYPSVPPNAYVYRKSFCVAQAGTFIITITGMNDDSGVVNLDGVKLTPAGVTFNYATRSTQTYIVALEPGCNCLDFRVFDLGFGITGLDALVDIRGGHLLKPACCDCPGCNNIPHHQPGLRGGNDDPSLGIELLNDPSSEARPMLVSIPNPATGETIIHYVVDTESDTHVELYNTAGQRVRVVDEGVRARGEHAVPLVTKGLPAGAYHLQLVYGSHRLSIPLNVQ